MACIEQNLVDREYPCTVNWLRRYIIGSWQAETQPRRAIGGGSASSIRRTSSSAMRFEGGTGARIVGCAGRRRRVLAAPYTALRKGSPHVVREWERPFHVFLAVPPQ